jgi:Ni/Co efflux regulator RcnB
MKKIVILVVALAMFGGATVNAQDAKAEAKKKAEEAALKKYDKNGNGKLDDDEKAAQKKDREEMIKKYDKNGDGKLDDAEKEAQKADQKKKGDKKKKE